jgi:hypothetical protein
VIADELFMWTLHDLDERLELGRGEYDALGMAWLLRKLLLNGQRSVVAMVAEGRSAPVRFRVRDNGEVSEIVYGWLPVEWPGGDVPDVELDVKGFLRHPVAQVRPLPARGYDEVHRITVTQLILFVANNLGAVHVGGPDDPWERAFWDFCWSASYSIREGQYSGGVMCLIDVARVVRKGLEPLRAEISPHVWPEGLPAYARKVRRLRPPDWR